MRSKLIMILFAYGNFWSAVCVSLQAPFFPREAESKGATPTQYGLVFGVYELVIIVVSPIVGQFMGRLPTKPMIAMGLFIIGLSVIIFGFLDRVPDGQVFISLSYMVRVLEALGNCIFSVANNTAVAILWPQDIATAFSVLETGFGLGLIVGPTVGSLLYDVGGYTLPFITLGSLLLLGSVGTCFVLPTPPVKCAREQQQQQTASPSRGLTYLLSDVGTLLNLMAIISSFTFLGYNAALLEPHLRQFDISVLLVGFIFIIDGGVFALTSPIVGKLCDKGFNPRLIIIVGYLLMSLGIACIGPLPFMPLVSSNASVVCVSLVAIGAGVGFKFVPSFFNCLSGAIQRLGFPDDTTTYSLVSSLVFSCGSLGSFIGPSLGGWLYDRYGYRYGTYIFFVTELVLCQLSVCHAYCCRHRSFGSNKLGDSSSTLSSSSSSSLHNYLTLDVEKGNKDGDEQQPLLFNSDHNNQQRNLLAAAGRRYVIESCDQLYHNWDHVSHKPLSPHLIECRLSSSLNTERRSLYRREWQFSSHHPFYS